MRLVYISLVILLCVVIEIKCERTHSGVCNGCQPIDGYTRIKRAKYYSSPPQRFYKRPPITYPIRGAFSYTPPPGYMTDDDEQPSPSFRFKVSRRPTNEGLAEEDINNIVKYLSKQDLDKIIESANEQERELPKYNKELSFERLNYVDSRPDSKYESRVVNKGTHIKTGNDQKFSLNGPFINTQDDVRPYSADYNNPNENAFEDSKPSRYPSQEQSALLVNQNNIQLNTQLESEETMQSHQFSFLNAKTQQNVNNNFNLSDGFIFTDSTIMQEEQLPKPSNLREDDHDISYTNNVPTIAKPDSFSYKVENFGALPLMNYHSKLDTVDSYRVPHYTVTSSEKQYAPAPISKANIPPVEPAPPASAAKEQSDAHLKAVKIWSHRSKGTAYTLHDDGTLSLEKPARPKTNYKFP